MKRKKYTDIIRISIKRLFLRIRWCFGRRVWNPGKLQDRLKRIYEENKNNSSNRFKILYFDTIYMWYRNIDKSNLLLKPWEPSWRKRQYGVRDVVSLLYGDILTIVESWLSHILIVMVESVHWILYRRISIALIWDKLNVIQQKEIDVNDAKARKKISRIDTLLIKKISEVKVYLQWFHLIYCCLLLSFYTICYFLFSYVFVLHYN